MSFVETLTPRDQQLAVAATKGFVPAEVYDIHAHPYHSAHFPAGEWAFLNGKTVLGCHEHRAYLQRIMPAQTIHGLYFGMPRKSADRAAMNDWVAEEVKTRGTALSRSLRVVSPADDPEDVAASLRSGKFCGLKVYHCYAARPDTMNASVEEYVPEWMWEITHETRGVIMLHIVRDGAMEDVRNQASLQRLCRAYPKTRLILAHVGRSFSYRNARHGLHALESLDNVVVDTSAICEADAFRAALATLGPRRILWGSDFAVSELRGRCVTTGELFFWLHPDLIRPEHSSPTQSEMTLVGVESLLSLREACEDSGLTSSDVEDIFRNNALRTLSPHLPPNTVTSFDQSQSGPELWQRARASISGGTGLLSKRAEMFDAQRWPAYFSRCSGCDVWDLEDRRYVDWVGGVGAVVLGYADPDVTTAVQRRLMLGSYCSLVNPQEVELAETLLALHPWAGKVRFARGGGDAMTMSVRIARAATGKSGVVFCGYHGWQDWYLAANLGDVEALNGHLLPGLEPKGVPRELKGTAYPFRYNDLASLEAALAKVGNNLAAVVMEPMRSQLPQDDFITKVAARCRAAGGIFIADEVTSGLRYGFPGALSRLGVEPDIAVYAKAISNGLPFGTVVGREAIMDSAQGSFISSSYWTDGVGSAAALAVLRKMQRTRVFERVWELGEKLQNGLRALSLRHPSCRLNVGGMPSTPTLSFDLGSLSRPAQTVYIRSLLKKGSLASTYHYVMFAHTEERCSSFLTGVDETLGEIARLLEQGELEQRAGSVLRATEFARLA